MLKKILNYGILALLFTTALKAAPLPQRIASGTVGSDETLLKLLQGEEHRLVALSTFATDARYSFLTEVPKSVKARVGDSMETLLVLQPDLVVLASYTAPEIAQQLKNAKVNVQIQKSFGSVKDVEDNIRELGRLVGKDKEASQLVAAMEKDIEVALAKRPKCARAPTMIQYTSSDILPGTDTIIDDVAARVGFHNVLRDIKFVGWKLISHEILVQQNPDFIIASEAEAKDKASLLKKLAQSAAWQKLEATRQGRVILVPDRLLYTVSYHVSKLVEFLASQYRCPAR